MKKILLLLVFFIFIGLFLSWKIFKQSEESVKGALISPISEESSNPIFTPTPTLTPATPVSEAVSAPLSGASVPQIILKKTSYTISVFGDSMIDTMGDKLEFLEESLSSKYPSINFKLYNYGIGGQNVEQGLARFENSFNNKERQYSPLPTISSDAIIVGSFAYNPFSPHDKNKHYALLSQLVEKAKNVTPNVYLLAEIAPLKIGFGKGKNGVNWTDDERYKHAVRIIEQLDNAVNVSSTKKVKLINAYYESKIDGEFGDPYYVNPDDGIHPSTIGHALMANLIAQSLRFE